MRRSRFFCENCGTEVRADAKVCRSCGRFFSSVRCPKCLYTDDARMFLHGCPRCGYAGGVGPAEAQTDADWEIVSVDGQPGYTRPRRDIPGWVWYVAAAVLTVAFAVLVVIYLNL